MAQGFTSGLFGLHPRTLMIGGGVLGVLVLGGLVYAFSRGGSPTASPQRMGAGAPSYGVSSPAPAVAGQPTAAAAGSAPAGTYGTVGAPAYGAPAPAAPAAQQSSPDLPPGHGYAGDRTQPGSASIVSGSGTGEAQAPTPSGLPDMPASHPDYAAKHGSDVPK